MVIHSYFHIYVYIMSLKTNVQSVVLCHTLQAEQQAVGWTRILPALTAGMAIEIYRYGDMRSTSREGKCI